MHVNQHNHDSNYNQNLEDDDIEHIYIKKFEDIQNNLDQFMEDHARKCLMCYLYFSFSIRAHYIRILCN